MSDFRDRLKAAQHVTPEHRERFERSMKQMTEQQLTPAQRTAGLLVVLFNVVGLAGMTWVIWVAIHYHLGPMIAIAFGILGVVVAAMMLMKAKEVITGTAELKTRPRVVAWIGWFGTLIYVAAMMVAQPSLGKGLGAYFTVLTLYPLIVMAAQLIQMTIGQSELAVREKMLEMELRLAEMNEKLDRLAK